MSDERGCKNWLIVGITNTKCLRCGYRDESSVQIDKPEEIDAILSRRFISSDEFRSGEDIQQLVTLIVGHWKSTLIQE